MAEYQGREGFLGLMTRLEGEGGIQVVVVYRMPEVPDLVWLLKVLAEKGVYLVSIEDEIDTRPYGLTGAGQGRFVNAVARWVKANYRSEEEEETKGGVTGGEVREDQPLRAMTGKEIKAIKAKRAELGVMYSADDADDVAGAVLEEWVMRELGVSKVQASVWLAEFA